jgi:hypothetical protein
MVTLRSNFDTSTGVALRAKTSGDGSSSHFLRLPLELRDYIYRMLLTTKYAFMESKLSDDETYPGRFDLRPSILLANKRIYMEAKRVLYMENNFAIFQINHRPVKYKDWAKYIPVFKRLPEEKVPNPKLRIIIEPIAKEMRISDAWFTLITTAECIPSVMFALWENARNFRFYQTASLTLHFHNKVRSRCQLMHDQFVSPWMHMQGFGKISLTGDVSESMVRDFEERRVRKWCPNELACSMQQFLREAEKPFDRGDFAAARYQWVYMQAFWLFDSIVGVVLEKKFSPWEFYAATAKLARQAKFRVVLLLITNHDYRRFDRKAQSLLQWCQAYNLCRDPIFEAKVDICRLFSITAHSKKFRTMEFEILDRAVASLRQSTLFADKYSEELRNELCLGIDNSLVELGCRRRCGRAKMACVASEGGPDWEVRPEYRSFWDWLGVSE